MREFGNYQAGGIPRRIIEQATREIANYTVSLILDQNLIGSGTLVSAMGVSGILTAHHVARLIFKSEGNALGINVADHLHQCTSGGGLWLLTITIDPDKGPSTISYEAPLLAGVAFYQSDLQNKERRIVGHAPASIHCHLQKAYERRG